MKRQLSTLLHLLILLALSACGLVPANQANMPSPTAITRPTRLPDPVEEVGSCSSGVVVDPDVVDTWSPPPEAASITPLSCDEIGEVFAYDPQAPLDIQELGRRWEEGVGVTPDVTVSLERAQLQAAIDFIRETIPAND